MFVAVYLLAFAALAIASGNPVPNPDLETIVARMEQAQNANHAQFKPYIVTRDYKFFGSDPQRPSSSVTAEVTFSPPGTKNFKIEKASGSGHGERIVRKVLEHEAANAKDTSSTELSRKNYDFKFARADNRNGHTCFVLAITPKRREKDLVHGQIWVDSSTYLVHQVEGELAKSPSFWIKDVKVTLGYNQVAGMWLPTSTKAVAIVRFLGRHSMLAQDVNYQTTEQTASINDSQNQSARLLPRIRRVNRLRPVASFAGAVRP